MLPLLSPPSLAAMQPSPLLHFQATIGPLQSRLRIRIHFCRSNSIKRALQFLTSGP